METELQKNNFEGVDTCIITKYDLSEREKMIKKNFFKKKDDVKDNIKKEEEKKYYPQFLYNEENLEKLVKDKFNKGGTEELLNKKNEQIQNQNNINQSPGIPLNLLYSQNKILERNTDILHETQRSIHDLLVYNINSQKTKQPESYSNNLNLFSQLINPLYKSLDDMKISLKNLSQENNQKGISKDSVEEKVKDMISKHSDFKTSSSTAQRRLEMVERKEGLKEREKDNIVLKAIGELKNSIGQISSDMGKLETEFSSNLKKMLQENEKKNLNTLINPIKNSNTDKSNLLIKRNSIDTMDYIQCRNDLLEINQRKEEIIHELKEVKNKTNFSNIIKPGEKVNFSYSLEFDEEKNENSNIKSLNSTDKTNKFLKNNNNSKANVFLKNMKAEKLEKNEKNEGIQKKEPTKKKPIIKDSYTNPFSKEKPKECIRDESSNKKTTESFNEEEKVDSIVEKMNEYKTKMQQHSKKIKESRNDKNEIPNLISNENNLTVVNKSTEPTSSKYFRSPKFLNADILEVNKNSKEFDEKPETNLCNLPDFSQGLKKAEEELDKIKNSETNIRKGIKQVEVCPKDKNNENILSDMITKLCVEKLVKPKGVKETQYVRVPEQNNKEDNFMLPYKTEDAKVREITQNLIYEYMKKLISNKNKKPVSIAEESSSHHINIMDREKNYKDDKEYYYLLEKFQEDSRKRELFLNTNFEEILNRFNEIEKKMQINNNKDNKNNKNDNNDNDDTRQIISNNKISHNDQILFSNLPPQEQNFEEIINRITEKIKSNMHIHINLNDNLVKPSNTQAQIFHNEEILIQGQAKESENKNNLESSHDLNKTQKSSYYHPFSKKENMTEINIGEVPMPHMINLDEYEISSSYITDTRRSETEVDKKHLTKVLNLSQEKNESISDGQVEDSLKHTKYLDLNILNSFNKKVKNEIFKQNQNQKHNHYLQDSESEKKSESQNKNYFETENNSESMHSESNFTNEEKSQSSISINVNKHLANMESSELKKRNLYDSEEHKLFQANFKGVSTGLSQNETKFISQSGVELKSFKNKSNISPTSLPVKNKLSNPNIFSFQKALSNRSRPLSQSHISNKSIQNSQESSNMGNMGNMGSIANSLNKGSREDLEQLKMRQSNLNEKLKKLSENSMKNNNTILEHNSDGDATQEQKKKIYQTDESSFYSDI